MQRAHRAAARWPKESEFELPTTVSFAFGIDDDDDDEIPDCIITISSSKNRADMGQKQSEIDTLPVFSSKRKEAPAGRSSGNVRGVLWSKREETSEGLHAGNVAKSN